MHRNDTCSVMLIYMQKWCLMLMLDNTVKHPMNGQWIAYAYVYGCFLVCLYARKTEKEIEQKREKEKESRISFRLCGRQRAIEWIIFYFACI